MTASPFVIDIEKLREGKVEMDVAEKPEALELADLPDVHFEGAITGHLTYAMSGNDVFIRGRLKGRVRIECVRCLEPAGLDLGVKISLNFLAKKPEDELTAFDAEIEQMDVDYYTGEQLDPLPQIRDALLLEVPALPLCTLDCRGLCPHCGANLNRDGCDCAEPPMVIEEDSWKSKLRGLKLE